MRRKEKETSREDALAICDRSPYAVLSMTLPDGSPYCVPLSIARRGELFYFHCAEEGRKLEALRANPRVCLSFVSCARPLPEKFTMQFASALVSGTAEEVTQPREKLEALQDICRRYVPESLARFDAYAARSLARTSIWRVRTEEICGKTNNCKPNQYN